MWRLTLGLAVGAAIGSAVTYLWLGSAASRGSGLLEDPSVAGGGGAVARRTDPVPAVSALEPAVAAAITDPKAALREALDIVDPPSRYAAADRAATAWAQVDPRAALAEIAAIAQPGIKTALQTAVLRAWGSYDTVGLFDYLSRADAATRRQVLASGALYDVARSDPVAASAFAERLPLGQERSELLNMIASAYGARDPDAALAWAQGFASTDPNLAALVILGIAERDPDRAFELALSIDSPQHRLQGLTSAVQQMAGRDDAQARQLAERILALGPDEQPARLMQFMLMSWSGRNPAAAMDWLIANAQRVPPTAFQVIAEPFAYSDPAAAERYIDRVPAESRPHWLAAVAQSYARSDVQAALRFVEQFRGDPAYSAASVRVAQVLAQYDPRAAAELVATADLRPPETGALQMIAQQWAMREPRAAADWARGLSSPLRTVVTPGVVRAWAAADARAAQNWVMEMPAGPERDAALSSMLLAGGVVEPDTVLMSAFSDVRTREMAVLSAVGLLAASNPDVARRLVNEYVTDPTARAAAEERIERGANVPFAAFSAVPMPMPMPAGMVQGLRVVEPQAVVVEPNGELRRQVTP